MIALDPGPSLASRLSRQAKQLQQSVNLAKQATARLLTQQLITSTPIASGNARGNWIVSLDDPSTEYFKPPDRRTPGRSPEEAIAESRVITAEAKPNQAICIANNAPYINRLNEGYSKQAAAGFVESAVSHIASIGAANIALDTEGPELG